MMITDGEDNNDNNNLQGYRDNPKINAIAVMRGRLEGKMII